MTAIAEKLAAKLKKWQPQTAKEVERRVAELIELADEDALDVAHSRSIEQEVLDILDEPTSRRGLAGRSGPRSEDASDRHHFPA